MVFFEGLFLHLPLIDYSHYFPHFMFPGNQLGRSPTTSLRTPQSPATPTVMSPTEERRIYSPVTFQDVARRSIANSPNRTEKARGKCNLDSYEVSRTYIVYAVVDSTAHGIVTSTIVLSFFFLVKVEKGRKRWWMSAQNQFRTKVVYWTSKFYNKTSQKIKSFNNRLPIFVKEVSSREPFLNLKSKLKIQYGVKQIAEVEMDNDDCR